jgi:hypothetical protein
MVFEGTGAESDEIISGYVEQVRTKIAEMMESGRLRRETDAASTIRAFQRGDA